MMAHGVEQWRMLQVQTPKPPQTFNHPPNIRTASHAPNPMMTGPSPFTARHYFEGQAEGNPKAARGYSRDHRPDCKQVNIGLVVTPEGLPIGYEALCLSR